MSNAIVEDLLMESPSLKSLVLEFLPDSYRRARRNAIAKTGLQASSFPVECPYTISQVLDTEFLPWLETKIFKSEYGDRLNPTP